MASLLLFVLVIQIITYLINTIGARTIDSLLWLLYIKLPNQASQVAREQRHAKLEVIRLKREMSATSSQDEFAKWAKLRRRHDKAMEEYDVKNKKLSALKTSFDWTIKTVRWVSTTGVTVILQFWFSKSPIFDLPRGWLPWQVEWILSFPRAPLGTVSIQVWGGACGTVIALVGGAMGVAAPAFKKINQPRGEAQKMGTPRGSREQTPVRKTQ
ncbi:GET complex subunit get1 [Microsporum canis]|uniref:Protein GET1 n=1 Tax=Arthroderma otae (strain ATCC MYA-4605 / CBS 113480) TaxID=554155 RepID=GET1_ARTOC|nr:CHD5 domain-containing protein [Microsporum canis CBS 113480]C5FEL7.1 RecName: Full=Protein GET1; AltName: Full=Guided entry of tail-anchored proteins 1 [Microsporum canis CBS 113480]EEQ28341.1 CHD5 domain-containing protein [Microsporum canis CBS 113480]